eukprot:GHVU01061957.1.p1 GENE.GHVU01061957.1~~GHVU01061957.1.p1  ORF type:complete len:146 (+),score=21.93 GHVU01061957.1:3-440(+)
MVFWRKLMKKCKDCDPNILADDAKVSGSIEVDRIDQVAVHESQRGLLLIQRIHGEPTETQWNQACEQYTEEKRNLSTKTLEEVRLLKEIEGPISKFPNSSLYHVHKPEDILAFLKQQIQKFAKEAITCFEEQNLQRRSEASAKNV